jgi:hypothetical protein
VVEGRDAADAADAGTGPWTASLGDGSPSKDGEYEMGFKVVSW